MSKIGRNDPCPCGSGKKYKHCCANSNIIPFPNQKNSHQENDPFNEYENLVTNWKGPGNPPTFMETTGSPNKATEHIKQIQQVLDGKNFNSIEELQEYSNQYNAESNSLGIDDFLGLSPQQIHNILYQHFNQNKHIVKISDNLKNEDIDTIPIIKQTFFFLKKIHEFQPLKATQKGNLPRKFVQDLYYGMYEGFSDFRYKPNKEDDSMLITAHRFLLETAGLLKKVKNRFSLTKKGCKIIDENDYLELFQIIFRVFTEEFKWGYGDRYTEFGLIQASFIFNLYILKQKANTFIDSSSLGQIYLNAFPDLVREAASSWLAPEDEVIKCFVLRFLQRFCLPFGLLEEKKEGEKYIDQKLYYKTTPLFKKLFKWEI